MFKNEKEFEDAIINLLVSERGWTNGVINYPTERDLVRNWADILFMMNNEVDRLNGIPLNEAEINQLMNKINALRTPNMRNEFINGKTMILTRENEDDKAHFGKEISLKIFDRNEIAAGSSIYQIARQPKFEKLDPVGKDRRGDFMLLINGLPVIHVELKKDGVPIDKAIYQIKSYMHEGAFRGLFSLVQIFVAMTPKEMKYFANTGSAEALNKDYFFKWADFNNEAIGDWKTIASDFLSIPMAHQLIGYYTIADKKDDVLKVMRSYQIYATREIVDRVREKQRNNWSIKDQLGGYIWHTTGSGKTMTSFKAAELVSQLKYCDKVIFLVDRITLATQTVSEFEGFSNDEDIYATENTDALLKILSDDQVGRLIVTSIQKMSNIVSGKIDTKKLEGIKKKRLVFVVDEAHRSTFGSMMTEIKETYPDAIFFGFTGTPIQTKYENKDSTEITTADIFGNELHRYTLADGIRDGNVLAFDISKVETITEMELRRKYALFQAHVKSPEELYGNEWARETHRAYMDKDKHPIIEIENALGNKPFDCDEHREKVIKNIIDSWYELNPTNEFSAIFATSSIREAILYWRMFKEREHNLKLTCIFDKSDSFDEFSIEKEDGLKDIIRDYNEMYAKSYSVSEYAGFKADVANRLARKGPYRRLNEGEKIDIVIVVYQLLTGYDSKWVSMLFLDKVLEMHNLIQAFSRTNRLNGPEKPHGIIKYYRRTATMERNINLAVKEYSGDRPHMMFVDKIALNVKKINSYFDEIKDIFVLNKIENFSVIPSDDLDQKKFVLAFNKLYKALLSAKAQGFSWTKTRYYSEETDEAVELMMSEDDYDVLLTRYKEVEKKSDGDGTETPDIEFDYNIVEENEIINYEYMNNNFAKYIKKLFDEGALKEDVDAIRSELHKNFAKLPSKSQVLAEMIINDIESGDLKLVDGWDFNDYINDYAVTELDKQLNKMSAFTGVDKDMLKKLINLRLTEDNLNEYGRFDALVNTADIEKIANNLGEIKKNKINKAIAKIYLNKALKEFVLDGPYDLDEYNKVNL